MDTEETTNERMRSTGKGFQSIIHTTTEEEKFDTPELAEQVEKGGGKQWPCTWNVEIFIVEYS